MPIQRKTTTCRRRRTVGTVQRKDFRGKKRSLEREEGVRDGA
jgi:hypothetical protein